MRLVRVSAAIWSLFLLAGMWSAVAQQATVNHGVSLRGDPSTKNPPTGHLNRNSTVTLLEANPKVGFYHVKTADGKDGWVGVKYLNVEPQAGTSSGTGTSNSSTAPAA